LTAFFIFTLSLLVNLVVLLDILRPTLLRSFFGSEETLRVTSPDGKVDAVIIHVSAPATVEDTTEVYIVPQGQSVIGKFGDDYQRVFQGHALSGLTVTWPEDRFLEVHYTFGVIYFFKNHITYHFDPNERLYVVQIREIPKNESPLPYRFHYP
jgi:hypothetical protein